MTSIFARQKEVNELKRIHESGKPEFLAVYGRRRVGKTYLIREFFKSRGLYFALTGIKKASLRKQLRNFSVELARVFGKDLGYKAPKDWQEAFSQLREAIEKVKKQDRIILFFDELPWLASPKSEFLQDLDHFWNRYMSGDSRIIVVICGSAASWMIKKVIRDKGGLHGRLTAQIRLLPFDLRETEEYLRQEGLEFSRKEVLDIYMAIGGIPKYLNYIKRGTSPLQIVSALCFEGALVDEFQELYSSLFDKHERHVSVIQALAERLNGLTKAEISKKTGFSMGGGLNMILEELEQSGFILPIREFGNRKKEIRYRLIDEYSLFYLKWADRAKENNLRWQDEEFWKTLYSTSVGQSWSGYAFETVCFKHLPNIKKALGISGVLTSASGWVYKPPKGSKEHGIQVDLLIDRADHCINLCEIKYSSKEFTINRAYDKVLREKKWTFVEETKTKKSVHLTLISPYGVNKKSLYFGTPDTVLTMDALF